MSMFFHLVVMVPACTECHRPGNIASRYPLTFSPTRQKFLDKALTVNGGYRDPQQRWDGLNASLVLEDLKAVYDAMIADPLEYLQIPESRYEGDYESFLGNLIDFMGVCTTYPNGFIKVNA